MEEHVERINILKGTYQNSNTQITEEFQESLHESLRKKVYQEHVRLFKMFDDYLDKQLNEPYWLKIESVASIVEESIRHFDGKEYTLWAFCIMPNHVHLLLTTWPGAKPLWQILQNSKKYSARKANSALNRTGRFWEEESYDHLIKEANWKKSKEFWRVVNYILNNPVKAGFVKNWKEWPGSYIHPRIEKVCLEE